MTGESETAKPLDVCTEKFNNVGKNLEKITAAVEKTSDSAIRTDESLKGLWHEMKEQRKLIRKLPDRLNTHQRDCPALRAFLDNAAAAQNPPPAVQQQTQSSVSSTDNVLGLNFPKKLFFIFAGFGVTLGVAGYVLYLLGVFS